jgi:hypothetical protein
MKNESDLKALVKEKYGGIASKDGKPDKTT